jgi:hypothetical protein
MDKFRFFIRQIEKQHHLPDYRLQFTRNEIVSFFPRKAYTDIDHLPSISFETLEKARRLVEEAGTGWDF